MRHRSFGVTALAFSSVMVAIYGQYAAIALLLTGSAFTSTGSLQAAIALITGAVFLGLTVAAYVVGFGLWARKHWAWAGGVAVFVVFAIANVLLSAIATNLISAVLPSAGAMVAVWYLHRPATRTELLGTEMPAAASVQVGGTIEAAGAVH